MVMMMEARPTPATMRPFSGFRPVNCAQYTLFLKKVFKVGWGGIVVDVTNIDDKALVLVIFFHVTRALA
jgi:hypothetical protein